MLCDSMPGIAGIAKHSNRSNNGNWNRKVVQL